MPTPMTRSRALVLTIAVFFVACGESRHNDQHIAEHVFTNAYIYTANAESEVADSMAIRGDRILFVGSGASIDDLIDDSTRVHDMGGKMILPGFHDVHIHALDMLERDACDLEGRPMSLVEMVPFLETCIQRFELEAGDWLDVALWSFSEGNQTSARYPNLRAALDAVSTEHPIILRGDDGHHYAVNSKALNRATDPSGKMVGLSRATIDANFSEYRSLIGVAGNGEPDGGLTESAIALISPPGSIHLTDPALIMPKIAERLAESGITSIMDAGLEPEWLSHFKALEDSGKMSFRLQAAILKYYDYPRIENRLTIADIPTTVSQYADAREQYATTKYIRADAVKIFVDGVLEGNPYAFPPTLPNAAVLNEYQQPIFSFDNDAISIAGYVDLSSSACSNVQENESEFNTATAIAEFVRRNGHHPKQCLTNKGVFESDPEFVSAYVLELDKQGFTVHAHAIGDAAVRAAVDAIENARRINGPNQLPHAIAHAQIVHPDDQRRIGELGIFASFTYAWIGSYAEYQMMVEPFIDRLDGDESLFSMDNYYTSNVYPAKSIQAFGGVLTAGSDAPVDSRDPRPFENIEQAITRKFDDVDASAINADEALDIHSILRAYTINGARAMSQAGEVGSLETGKKADFIVVNANLVELAESDRADEISDVKVESTWFDGRRVFERGR